MNLPYTPATAVSTPLTALPEKGAKVWICVYTGIGGDMAVCRYAQGGLAVDRPFLSLTPTGQGFLHCGPIWSSKIGPLEYLLYFAHLKTAKAVDEEKALIEAIVTYNPAND